MNVYLHVFIQAQQTKHHKGNKRQIKKRKKKRRKKWDHVRRRKHRRGDKNLASIHADIKQKWMNYQDMRRKNSFKSER